MKRIKTLWLLAGAVTIISAQEPAAADTTGPKWYTPEELTISGMTAPEHSEWLTSTGQLSAVEKLSKRAAFRVRSESQLKRYGATDEIVAALKSVYGDGLDLPGPIWFPECDGWYSSTDWCFCVDIKNQWDHDCHCLELSPSQ